MFSIIIPTLNEEKFLPKLLGDLVEQTFQDFEVIHVDGESTDRTVEKALSFGDRLKISSHPATVRSPGYQRNLGATKAKGEWIICLDADIRLGKTALEEINKELENSDIDFFTTSLTPYPKKPIYVLMLWFIAGYTWLMQKTSKPFVTEALFGCRRETFLKVGGFNTEVRVNEGSELLERTTADGFKFRMLSSVRYTLHMRRIQQRGTLKSMIDQGRIGLMHIIGRELSLEKQTELYPMDDRYR